MPPSPLTAPSEDSASTPRPLRLSVLDQAPIPEGSSAGVALRNSVDLAKSAANWGYHRYWVAEHHGTPALACADPAVLIAAIGSQTARMRLGSGGVMLPHYSPLKVAETFNMLGGLFPGRIDLGIGRAAGTDPGTAFALQRDRRERGLDDFPEQLDELLAYLWNQMPADHPFARLSALLAEQREPGKLPEFWLLGSSAQSGIWAAGLGLPYCFADFINPRGAEIAAQYRKKFTPAAAGEQPRLMVAAWAVCAESDDEAQRLTSSHRMLMELMMRGQLIAVPPVEEALRWLTADELPLDAPPRGRRTIVGNPQRVKREIEALAAEYGAEEVMLVNILYDHSARKRSYELVAEAFGLSG